MNTANAGSQTNLLEQKNLPLVARFTSAPAASALPGHWKLRRASRPFAPESAGPADLGAPWTARTFTDPRDAALAAAPPLPDHPKLSVHKVINLISREIILVRQLGADALAIVLKPDPRTELFLQISRRDEKTAALIRCERGDYDQLQQNWAQLQSVLAGLQVTLAPLQRPTLASLDLAAAAARPASSSADQTGRERRA